MAQAMGQPKVTETRTADWSRELVKEIAMDIGKEVAAYVEVMYPNAVSSTSSTFRLSLRNCIFNEIMAAIEVTDEGKVIARLRDRKKFRRWWVNAYRALRRDKKNGGKLPVMPLSD